MKKKHVIIVLDSSGSMNPIWGDAKKGVAQFVDGTYADAVDHGQDVNFTLITFNSMVSDPVSFDRAGVNDAIKDKRCGGMTALYDAIVLAYELATGSVGYSSVDVVVQTDGEENASRHCGIDGVVRCVNSMGESGIMVHFLTSEPRSIKRLVNAGAQFATSSTFTFDATGAQIKRAAQTIAWD